ncbi:hypothetical protein DU508_07510 [Pedobacter chinensis]|uniref:Uncharacterized protein n=1 Tax=Pedobacter chinensis TaxID=2282421 RepID=A0A369Q0P3_9SPHI|nr:hypothetical protein DU508_07510 [Pedobacter chinensis]
MLRHEASATDETRTSCQHGRSFLKDLAERRTDIKKHATTAFQILSPPDIPLEKPLPIKFLLW